MSKIFTQVLTTKAFCRYSCFKDILFSDSMRALSMTFQTNLRFKHPSGRKSRANSLPVVKPVKVTPVKKRMQEGSFRNYDIAVDSEMDFDETYEDEMASRISRYSTKADALRSDSEFTRSLVQDLRRIRKHTIKEKYFRPAPLPDFLTWEAKEQIRFLHKYDPHEWSISNLSEYFPVSEHVIKGILKRDRHIYQLEDVLRHDEMVLSNWEKLHAQLESGKLHDQLNVNKLLEMFFNSEDKCLLSYATSQPDLPKPRKKWFSSKQGPFSAIVKDCLEIQQRESCTLLDHKIPAASRLVQSQLKDTALLLQKLKKSPMKNKFQNLGTDSPNDARREETLFKSKQDQSLALKYEDRSSTRSLKVNCTASNNGTFCDGKDVYDENGDFLYRIP